MRRLLLLLLASPAAAQVSPGADELRAGYQSLEPGARREAMEWFRFECEGLNTYQADLVARALALEPRDPGLFPPYESPRHYDPREHAPALPIERRVLPEDSPALAEARADFVLPPRPNELRRAYGYDFGRRAIVRLGDPEDPERLFENALHGYPPDADLAVAIVLARLDDGSQRKALAAFEHTYTDLDGNVYPGVRLYDAWRSGREMKMPDVDALGVVHEVLGDWETWVSPVPAAEHHALYRTIHRAFVKAKQHRELCEAFARTYLVAHPVPPGKIGALENELHALWAEAGADPQILAERLSAADDGEAWVVEAATREVQERRLITYGTDRAARLELDEKALRRVLVGVLRGMGALE